MINIAIIPARKGSKRLQNKNMLKINGMTLIEHAVDCAKKSGLFDLIVVSTDYENLKINGALIHQRDKVLCGDEIKTQDVIDDVLWVFDIDNSFDNICLLQPTSPLRTVQDITDSYSLLREADSVISISESKKINGAIYWMKSDCDLFTREIMTFKMPDERSIDIDFLDDYEKAKEFHENNKRIYA